MQRRQVGRGRGCGTARAVQHRGHSQQVWSLWPSDPSGHLAQTRRHPRPRNPCAPLPPPTLFPWTPHRGTAASPASPARSRGGGVRGLSVVRQLLRPDIRVSEDPLGTAGQAPRPRSLHRRRRPRPGPRPNPNPPVNMGPTWLTRGRGGWMGGGWVRAGGRLQTIRRPSPTRYGIPGRTDWPSQEP